MNDFPPGRAAALARLAAIRPDRYARSRNYLAGAVTRLSPYLRHGIIDLAEVRDAVLVLDRPRRDIEKFVQELGWRDYWRRVYGIIGQRIWENVEPYKTGVADYAEALPPDIESGTTGLACMDGFVRDLVDGGYVHNHARMYFASYVVHHRRIRWQAGARFYLRYLLDGDPASNNLSWQWVASTFGFKPYIFNRENLERYTEGMYCRTCPLATAGCPFEASYETLDAKLFPNNASDESAGKIDLMVPADAPARAAKTDGAIVWIHPDALNDTGVARRAAPHAPTIVAGVNEMHERDAWSDARRAFVDGSLRDMRVDERASGDAVDAIVAFARASKATTVITTASPDPLLQASIARIRKQVPVLAIEPPAFASLDRAVNLGRFSRYWRRAEVSAFERTQVSTDPNLRVSSD